MIPHCFVICCWRLRSHSTAEVYKCGTLFWDDFDVSGCCLVMLNKMWHLQSFLKCNLATLFIQNDPYAVTLCTAMPWPGFEPGLLRPQRRVLTTIRSRRAPRAHRSKGRAGDFHSWWRVLWVSDGTVMPSVGKCSLLQLLCFTGVLEIPLSRHLTFKQRALVAICKRSIRWQQCCQLSDLATLFSEYFRPH